MKRKVILSLAAVVAALSLSSCSKAMEQFQDSPVAARNAVPADVISFPDGFSPSCK